jgi:hypothetical protein
MQVINNVEQKKSVLANYLNTNTNSIIDDSDTLFYYQDEGYLVVDEAERRNLLIEMTKENHEGYSYIFSTIAQATKTTIDDVENHFLSDILLQNGVVHQFLGTRFVDGNNVNKYIDKTVGKAKFFENLADKHIKDGTVENVLSSGYDDPAEHYFDGFYVYWY